ncbi:MAG: tRNA lysidine(34) synthetase TilS [Cruoricaptor ignavus]|nr:tRNA lysidine(34) synthetase TilS [Cruoricaptor ignavus]
MSILTFNLFHQSLSKLLAKPEEHTFLLAVSGGADSMVLADLFQKSGLSFQLAHINYKLRGQDSDDDQTLVQNFCKKHNVKLHLYEVSERDEKPENSIQLWARDLRYRFFKEKLSSEKLDFLVTAHHLNDELETFLINLSRGSGMRGLSGMPKNKNQILRPLLDFPKEEIYRFAKEENIAFREDKSNKKNDYLRNKIRNEIVPKLQELNPDFLENFKKSRDILSENQDFKDREIERISKSLIIKKEDLSIIDKTKLEQEPDLVKFEILKSFGFDNDNEIQKIFSAETGRSFYSENYQLLINRNELIFKDNIIEKNNNEELSLEMDEENHILIPKSICKEILEIGNCEWFFDRGKIKFPLKIRHKKEGDIFYPMGMNGKKKVAKFFKDKKLSILAKSKIWILCDDDDEILGIIPYRQDRRYAKTQNTKDAIKFLV